MTNAIVGRPSSYLMDVDYNQADGGTTTTQLMPSYKYSRCKWSTYEWVN